MLYLGEFVEAQGFLNKGAAAAAAEGDIITHSHVGSVGLVGSEVNRCDRPRRRLARVFIQLDRPAARVLQFCVIDLVITVGTHAAESASAPKKIF